MGFNYFQRTDPLAPVSTPGIPQQLEDQLGSGLAIPLQIINDTWVVRSGSAKVAQDIYACLSTPVGRRLFQPDYGSLLPRLIFEPFLPTLVTELKQATMAALNTWVPQIHVNSVVIDDSNISNNMLTLIVIYNLNGTSNNQAVKIVLATNDQIQIPAGTLSIGGQPVFPQV